MSKEKTIAKLIPVFRQHGYEGATISRLSQATGLGKASLYYYFPDGKEGMAAAVLEYINNWFTNEIFQSLRGTNDPAEKIRKMSKSLDEFYRSGQDACFLSVMSVGEANNLFHNQIEQALKVWIDSLTQVLQEAGIEPDRARQRSENAIMQIQGALVLARVLNDTKPFERVIKSLPEMLLGGI
ncbi:TetR/AcrR family transcriptional regulator [Pleurocapsales cyanobacterium LEGE 06147]|nr:TetR/AcrR family transcriptional regulator [Pleurocapsales cyanobacterium LEGE 06147]